MIRKPTGCHDGAEYDLEIEVHRYVLEFARAQGPLI